MVFVYEEHTFLHWYDGPGQRGTARLLVHSSEEAAMPLSNGELLLLSEDRSFDGILIFALFTREAGAPGKEKLMS